MCVKGALPLTWSSPSSLNAFNRDEGRPFFLMTPSSSDALVVVVADTDPVMSLLACKSRSITPGNSSNEEIRAATFDAAADAARALRLATSEAVAVDHAGSSPPSFSVDRGGAAQTAKAPQAALAPTSLAKQSPT